MYDLDVTTDRLQLCNKVKPFTGLHRAPKKNAAQKKQIIFDTRAAPNANSNRYAQRRERTCAFS